jgi:hypothetical protein
MGRVLASPVASLLMLRCASPDFLIVGAFNACPEFAVQRFAVFETFSQEMNCGG